jgi:hypothetical protein
MPDEVKIYTGGEEKNKDEFRSSPGVKEYGKE